MNKIIGDKNKLSTGAKLDMRTVIKLYDDLLDFIQERKTNSDGDFLSDEYEVLEESWIESREKVRGFLADAPSDK